MESGAQRALHRSSAASPPPDLSNLLLWDPLTRFPQAGCSSSSCKIAPCNKSGGRQPPFSCPLPCAHPGAHPARSAPPRSPLPVRGHLQPSGGPFPFPFPLPIPLLLPFPFFIPLPLLPPARGPRAHRAALTSAPLLSAPRRPPLLNPGRPAPNRTAPHLSAPLRTSPHRPAPPGPEWGGGRGSTRPPRRPGSGRHRLANPEGAPLRPPAGPASC